MLTPLTRFSFGKTFRDLTTEALQQAIADAHTVLRYLVYNEGNLSSDPCVYMWKTYESSLVVYGQLACMELNSQRRIHTLDFWNFSRVGREMMHDKVFYYEYPPWHTDEDFVRSCRSYLLRTAPGHSWAATPKNLPLLWPVVDTESEVASYELKVSRADKELLTQKKLSIPASVRSRVVNL